MYFSTLFLLSNDQLIVFAIKRPALSHYELTQVTIYTLAVTIYTPALHCLLMGYTVLRQRETATDMYGMVRYLEIEFSLPMHIG